MQSSPSHRAYPIQATKQYPSSFTNQPTQPTFEMRTSFIITILAAFAAQLALAIPPACLLHAVNTQDEPSDLSAICGDGAQSVQSYMAQNCGNNANNAQKAFIASCSSAGTSVAAYTATANSTSSTSTRSSSATTTGTGMITSTARSSSSSSGSATGSAGSTLSTAAANMDYRSNFKPMAAAAIALVGAVAAL